MRQKLIAYAQLTRFDRPVGIELLLWPTLWGLFFASFAHTGNMPPWQYIVIFTLGAVFMRAAGCAINDYADRDFDAQVERTKNRPLATGAISPKEALAVFAALLIMSASLLLFLPIKVFYWSFGAVLLASIYPFMKRFTYLPQFVLGAAFSWAIPMTYIAITGTTDVFCWILYVANLLWTVAYDTQYAMTDREDDLKAGIKSTAILFGKHDVLIISLLQMVFMMMMAFLLQKHFGNLAMLALLMPLGLFIHQYQLIRHRKASDCFKAFLNNVWVGRVFFCAIVLLNFIKV